MYVHRIKSVLPIYFIIIEGVINLSAYLSLVVSVFLKALLPYETLMSVGIYKRKEEDMLATKKATKKKRKQN